MSNLNNFHSLEVVDRVSETQLQVGENSDWIIWRLKGWGSGDLGVERCVHKRSTMAMPPGTEWREQGCGIGDRGIFHQTALLGWPLAPRQQLSYPQYPTQGLCSQLDLRCICDVGQRCLVFVNCMSFCVAIFKLYMEHEKLPLPTPHSNEESVSTFRIGMEIELTSMNGCRLQ